jgi:hypothetical protein
MPQVFMDIDCTLLENEIWLKIPHQPIWLIAKEGIAQTMFLVPGHMD